MTEQLTASPISPSLPSTQIRASGLGMSDGSGQVTGAQYDGGEIQAGEADDTYDVEDVQPLQTLTTPELPSREEIESHRVDHWPYRSWCKECVEGFGRERDHVHRNQKVAIVSMDYAFVTPKGPIVDRGEEGWDDPNALKLLIVKDSKSGSVFEMFFGSVICMCS